MPSQVPVASESEPNAGTTKSAACSGSRSRCRWAARLACSQSECDRSALGAGPVSVYDALYRIETGMAHGVRPFFSR